MQNDHVNLPQPFLQLVVVASLRANKVADSNKLHFKNLNHGLFLRIVLGCCLFKTTEIVAHRSELSLNKIVRLLLLRLGRRVDGAVLVLVLVLSMAVGTWSRSSLGRERSTSPLALRRISGVALRSEFCGRRSKLPRSSRCSLRCASDGLYWSLCLPRSWLDFSYCRLSGRLSRCLLSLLVCARCTGRSESRALLLRMALEGAGLAETLDALSCRRAMFR
jgi:hypothetical protein